jgi:antibiotic biosynthesis monooxygenase (ABM) superfamily enzyme
MNQSDRMESDDTPVTVDVALSVKPACEQEFERILTEMIAAAEMFEGHLGVNIFRPDNTSNLQYRIVFKFDRHSNYRLWENSEIRKGYLAQIDRLILDKSKLQVLTGLETWFTLSTNKAMLPPPRYKMFLLTWGTIFILINFINRLVIPNLSFLPPPLATLLVSGLMVFAMTYIIMPRVTKLFAKWLYPKAS